MKCSNMQQKLALYISGDLPEHDNAEVRSHLENCRECAAELESLKQSGETMELLIQADTPDPLPYNFSHVITHRIVEEKTKRVRRTGKKLTWLWGKPALVSYAIITAFFLGVGLSWQYLQKTYRLALLEYSIVAPAFQRLQTELGEEVPYYIFEGSSPDLPEELTSVPCVYLIMHKSVLNDYRQSFSIDYYGESNNINTYRRYPWINQRKNDLINKAGSPENIYIIICPIPGTSKRDRIHLKNSLHTEFKSSLNKGI